MSLVTSAVKFTLHVASGVPPAGLTVRAALTVADMDGGVVVDLPAATGITDALGQCTLNLWPNSRGVAGSQYTVGVYQDARELIHAFLITVPESGSVVLAESIINQAPYPTVDAAQIAITTAQAAVVDAQGYAAAADASAIAAAASAGTASTAATTATTQAGIATAKAVLTAADAVATAADRVQTGFDCTAAAGSASAASGSASTATTQAGIADTRAAAAEAARDAALAAQAAAEGAQADAETAASAAGLDALATAADAAATAADVLAIQGATDATAADVVLTHADVVLTHADVVLTHADVSTVAADKATTSGYKDAAAASASTATTQANNAAASFDSFDDRYLGAKAAAPTLDNDGAALLTGALYWDTALAALRVWTGAAWTNTTELDDRVLADQQLLGAAAYATDMALQAVRNLVDVPPQIAAINANVATYDLLIEQLLNAMAHALDLAGVTARSIAGGDVLLRAGTAGTPSLQAFGDPDTGLFFPAANEAAIATAGLERLRLDANGYLGLGTTTPTGLLDVNADKVRVRTAKTPASASAAGNAGEICWDASYLYICTATNTWRRAAHGTW